ncbi:MAG: hypothetical protein P9M14_12415 [Candidatus Alcyoniella australis]|nr:hypothetical protein [Candidatus Alcyoniella australis]
MWKKILLGLAAIILVLLISAALYLNYRLSHFNGELLDEQYLQAKYLEYEPFVQQIEARTVEDHQAFNSLKELYAEDPDPIPVCRKALEGDCRLVAAFIYEHQQQIDRLDTYDQQYREIMADGFVLHHEALFEYFDDLLVESRGLFQWQMEAALLDGLRSRPHDAAERILLNMQFVQGLFDTPSGISLIIGFYSQTKLNRTLVYLLPALTSDDLRTIKKALEEFPDAKQSIINCNKMEIVTFVRHMDLLIEQKITIGIGIYIENQLLSTIADRFWPESSVKRERLVFIKMLSDFIDEYQEWIDDGAQGETVTVQESLLLTAFDRLEILLAPASYVAVKNFDSLADRARDVDRRRVATIRAIDAELQRRETGGDQAITIQIDDNQQIVLGAEYGCIEQIEEQELPKE